MSVGFIFSIAGPKMGLNPADPEQRPTLVRLLNEAATELYMQSDMPGSLMEQVFKVNGDQTITMPSYVGNVRAVRELNSQIAWHINQMRPRYNQINWKDCWRNVRLRNKQCLQATVSNQSVGVITVPFIESPNIIVSVSGPTPNASCVSENIQMSSTTMNTVNTFLDYISVRKNVANTCDVTLSDVDGKVLTVIPNNELIAEYQVLDISSFPFLAQNTSVMDNYVEILYKKTLSYLSNDNDEFPALDCDYVVINKMMQLWGEEQNKPDMALGYDTKATRTLARITEEQNRSTEDMVSLVRNPHDSIHGRIGVSRMRRYWWGHGRSGDY